MLIRLSSRQYSTMREVTTAGAFSLDTAKTVFQGTLGSLVQRGYVGYRNGQIYLTQRGKDAFSAMTSENIYRKSTAEWGKRVILVLPKSLR